MRLALVTGLAAVAAGCVSGRRAVAPVADETIDAPPAVTFRAVRQAISDQGLPMTQADPAGGLVETAYVDIASYRAEATQYPTAERIVRFRILLTPDSGGQGTQAVFQAVYDPFNTGLANTRRNERAIPQDHPAMDVVREIVRRVRRLAEGG